MVSWRWCSPESIMVLRLLPAFRNSSWTGFSLCMIFIARCQDHVQPILHSLHWLYVPERISFRLGDRCLHGSAPGYLASDLQRVSDPNARRRLHSSCMICSTSRSTHPACYHRRPCLPVSYSVCLEQSAESVRASPSLTVFHSRMKTELFALSYS